MQLYYKLWLYLARAFLAPRNQLAKEVIIVLAGWLTNHQIVGLQLHNGAGRSEFGTQVIHLNLSPPLLSYNGKWASTAILAWEGQDDQGLRLLKAEGMGYDTK